MLLDYGHTFAENLRSLILLDIFLRDIFLLHLVQGLQELLLIDLSVLSFLIGTTQIVIIIFVSVGVGLEPWRASLAGVLVGLHDGFIGRLSI